MPNLLATVIAGLSLVCTTVLSALHVIPADIASHILSVSLGGGLAFLSPPSQPKAP